MTTTSNPPASEPRMLLRAEWLRDLSQVERDALFELPLREVDARFDDWLASSGGEEP